MPNVVHARKARGKNAKERFVKSVMHAGKGGIVLSEDFKGKRILWRVNSLNKTSGGSFKLTALYSFKKKRAVKIKQATHFMERASMISGKRLEKFYMVEANRQFKKYGIK